MSEVQRQQMSAEESLSSVSEDFTEIGGSCGRTIRDLQQELEWSLLGPKLRP